MNKTGKIFIPVFHLKRQYQLRVGAFQLYRGDQFYWCRKLEYMKETTDLSQVTKLNVSHTVVSSTP